MCRRDQPRKSPKAPPKPFTRSSKSNANNSSSVFTIVFSADRKKEDDEDVFQYTVSSLIFKTLKFRLKFRMYIYATNLLKVVFCIATFGMTASHMCQLYPGQLTEKYY